MLYVLKNTRLIDIRTWQKVLNHRTLEIPKIHHTFINSSSSRSFNINNDRKHNDILHQKDVSVIKTALNTFKRNPYVRIMRLDRPIGNFNSSNDLQSSH